MPIRRYAEKGVVFTPQALSAMSKALEATTEILGIEGDEAKRQTVWEVHRPACAGGCQSRLRPNCVIRP